MKWNFGDHLYSKCCTQIHILLLFICSPMMVLTITSRYLSTETIPLRTQTLCTVAEMPADAHICVWAGLLCDCIEWTKFCPTCRKSSQSLRLLMNPIQFPKTALDCTSACATNQANRTAGLKLKGQISDVFHSLGLDLRNRGGQIAIWAMPKYTRFFFGWGFPKTKVFVITLLKPNTFGCKVVLRQPSHQRILLCYLYCTYLIPHSTSSLWNFLREENRIGFD